MSSVAVLRHPSQSAPLHTSHTAACAATAQSYPCRTVPPPDLNSTLLRTWRTLEPGRASLREPARMAACRAGQQQWDPHSETAGPRNMHSLGQLLVSVVLPRFPASLPLAPRPVHRNTKHTHTLSLAMHSIQTVLHAAPVPHEASKQPGHAGQMGRRCVAVRVRWRRRHLLSNLNVGRGQAAGEMGRRAGRPTTPHGPRARGG